MANTGARYRGCVAFTGIPVAALDFCGPSSAAYTIVNGRVVFGAKIAASLPVPCAGFAAVGWRGQHRTQVETAVEPRLLKEVGASDGGFDGGEAEFGEVGADFAS